MMQKKPRILVVGSFVMDVIATTERVPPSGQTVYGKEFHMAPGGKGANQALLCARLGADVTMMGCVGDDLFGEKLLEIPKAAGVDVSRVIVREGVTSGVGHVTLEVTNHTALLCRLSFPDIDPRDTTFWPQPATSTRYPPSA